MQCQIVLTPGRAVTDVLSGRVSWKCQHLSPCEFPDDKDDTGSGVSWQGSHSLASVSAHIQLAPAPSQFSRVTDRPRVTRAR